jgi:hypothetical protein
MNRRKFLQSSAVALAAVPFARKSLAEESQATAGKAENAQGNGEVVIDMESAGPVVPDSFCGLSYELSQLMDPNFFAATNEQLIAFFRLLTPRGVLRLGGNTSETCWLKVDDSAIPPALESKSEAMAENWMPQNLYKIDAVAVDHLAEFLNAANWDVIFGLNFGHSTPARAAREAEYVAGKLGDRLLYFQIGNEPDLYRNATNKTRPANWGFDDYLAEWLAVAEAISRRVPDAKFGGPDVAGNSDWVTMFERGAAAKMRSRVVAITSHHYAEGPPDDPAMTTERLLRTDPEIGRRTKAIADAAAKDGILYRMTEGNSCYRGGKPGMSDAFASALWGADYMLTLASNGCAGVNLHGGSRSALRASLGNHMPGENLDAAKQSDRKGGYYTPIAGELDSGFSARPLFYGMLLANQFAGAQVRPVTLATGGANSTAYACEKNGQLRVAIFNKDTANDVEIKLRMPAGYQQAKLWRLTAPALDAKADVTLAGATVSADMTWEPVGADILYPDAAGLRVKLPRASAVLAFLEH